jgi:predicted amidophosphoribosyltransferase
MAQRPELRAAVEAAHEAYKRRLERERKRSASNRVKLHSEGLCASCWKEYDPDSEGARKWLCAECAERARVRERERRRFRRESGVCERCGGLVEKGHTMCARHLEEKREGMWGSRQRAKRRRFKLLQEDKTAGSNKNGPHPGRRGPPSKEGLDG